MRAVSITKPGGPEALVVAELPDPVPGIGEQLFDVLAAGVNYADTHQTEGTYLSRQKLPFTPGSEVVVHGDDGHRYLGLLDDGGYAERVALNPERLFRIPDGVESPQALTTLVQGSTAWHLLRTCTRMKPGDSVVVSAGAGGVGTVAIQLAKRWGAGRVIATASTDTKRKLAIDLGADIAVDSTAEELTAELVKANGGARIDIVLEMTGGSVFDQSLAALAPGGRLAVYGLASRTPPSPIIPGRLMARSQSVIGFWLNSVLSDPQLLTQSVEDQLDLIAKKELKPVIGATYGLDEVAEAHRALLDRSSVGKLTLDLRRGSGVGSSANGG